MFDTCHKKTDLKVFVIVIPKEGLATTQTGTQTGLNMLYSVMAGLEGNSLGMLVPVLHRKRNKPIKFCPICPP